MKPWKVGLVFAAGVLAGCMAAGPPAPAQSPGSGLAAAAASGRIGTPLVLDRADFRLGTTVHYSRIPSTDELYELRQLTGLAHVVLTLNTWPSSYAEIQSLDQIPQESDLIVVMPGFPASREAADAWNLLNVRVRIVLVATGAPPSVATLSDLNAMRALERVIVETEYPSRSGFERLQRPLSFRVVRD